MDIKIKKIVYSSVFVKHLHKLPFKLQLLAVKKENLFRQDPFNPSLKTHKLSGKLSCFYSFSVNYQYRILFSFEKDRVELIDIGTHQIYK